MQINPYLSFNGTCETAFKFYAKALGGEIEAMMPFEGSPMAEHVAPDWRNKIMHATLNVEGDVLMGSDAPPDRFQPPQGFHVSLQFDDVAKAERVFAALADKGTVHMPIQQTSWARRFGMCVDQFGIPWMINCE
jgi:PhnB protein